jgi:hypothetical protein
LPEVFAPDLQPPSRKANGRTVKQYNDWRDAEGAWKDKQAGRKIDRNRLSADWFGASPGTRTCRHFQAHKRLKMKEPGNRVFRFRLIFGQDGQSISLSPGTRTCRHFQAHKRLKMKEPGNRVFRFRLIFGQDGQ